MPRQPGAATSLPQTSLAAERPLFCAAAVLFAASCCGAQQVPSTPPATGTAAPSATGQGSAPSATPEPSTHPTCGSTAGSSGTAGSTPTNSAASVADATRYIIGADDVLQITVWNEQKMSGVLPVRPDGMISIALIGDLPAAGRTPMQLGDDIKERAKKYIQDPNVTVAVTAVNSQRVFMVCEVAKVGPVGLTPGMTPLQAIAAAGGPGPFANVKKIYILRGAGAQQKKIPFNYKEALKGDNRQGVELHPGDTVVIP